MLLSRPVCCSTKPQNPVIDLACTQGSFCLKNINTRLMSTKGVPNGEHYCPHMKEDLHKKKVCSLRNVRG